MINLQNISKLIFEDKKVQQLMPEFSGVFRKWELGIRSGIDSIVKDALIELLNNIDDTQVERLSNFWGKPVTVSKLNSRITRDLRLPIDSAEIVLNEIEEQWNFSISRDGDTSYISLWR